MRARTGPVRVQAVGECMLEVLRHGENASVGYAGDTYNTAVYLSRVARMLGAEVEVSYLAGVGDDVESERMRASWRAEHLIDQAVVVPGAAPGLYLVRTDDHGEREFSYWRAGSAAARLLSTSTWVPAVAGDVVYLSAITLQLMSPESRDALRERLTTLREGGTLVAFDSNYRPSAWTAAAQARREIDAFLALTDIALVTLADEQLLGGVDTAQGCAARLAGLGVGEVVVKDGAHGAWVSRRTPPLNVPARRASPVDTTAAGDSFNGAYLAARIHGWDGPRAAEVGNAVAAAVIELPGAIIPAARMPDLQA